MFRLGIDASGGDNGEIEVCKAIVKSIASNDTITYYVFGDEDIIRDSFDKLKKTIGKEVKLTIKTSDSGFTNTSVEVL